MCCSPYMGSCSRSPSTLRVVSASKYGGRGPPKLCMHTSLSCAVRTRSGLQRSCTDEKEHTPGTSDPCGMSMSSALRGLRLKRSERALEQQQRINNGLMGMLLRTRPLGDWCSPRLRSLCLSMPLYFRLRRQRPRQRRSTYPRASTNLKMITKGRWLIRGFQKDVTVARYRTPGAKSLAETTQSTSTFTSTEISWLLLLSFASTLLRPLDLLRCTALYPPFALNPSLLFPYCITTSPVISPTAHSQLDDQQRPWPYPLHRHRHCTNL